jgi:phage shock protein C
MNTLYRSQRDKKLFGLCGGLAETLNVDATLLRLIVVITAFFSGGAVILLYIIACLVIPKEPTLTPPYAYGTTPPSGFPYPNQQEHYQAGGNAPQGAQTPAAESNLDEMMKDIEKKALWKEIEELRAKVAKYEKGES